MKATPVSSRSPSTPEAIPVDAHLLLLCLGLLALAVLLPGCDALRPEKEPPGDEYVVLIESLPSGGAQMECVLSYEQEGKMQADQFRKETPIEAGPWYGDAFSMMCASTETDTRGEFLISLMQNGEVVREEAGRLPIEFVQLTWPDRSEVQASWGLKDTGIPTIFDIMATSGDGTQLTDPLAYGVPSKALADTLRAGSYDAVGAYSGAFLRSGKVDQRLYTPEFWQEGTSFVHFDTNTNGLMLPLLPKGQAFLSPLLTASVLKEMGWGTEPASPASRQAISPGRFTSATTESMAAPMPEHVCRLKHAPADQMAPDRAQWQWDGQGARSSAGSSLAAGQAASADVENLFAYRFEGEWPKEAKKAFRQAGAIWTEHLGLKDSIEVQAAWEALDEGALASGAPVRYYRNFPGAGHKDVFYPAALANRLADEDLAPGEADIDIIVNSDVAWYYGADYRVPEGESSFLTVLTHELAHGLGFLGTMTVHEGE